MTEIHWSDEQLVAYADGELPAAEQAALEAAMERDMALAERVALMFETRELSREVFDAQLKDTPVPAALLASVQAMVEQDRAQKERDTPAASSARRAPQRTPWWRQLAQRLSDYALPAGAFASVAAGVLGFMLGTGSQAPVGTLAAVGATVPPSLAALLGTLPAGQSSPQSPAVTVVGSYRDAAGTLCRDFSVRPDDKDRVEAVACLMGDGQWRLRFAALADDGANGFTPASTDSAVESYLKSIGAEEPLDPAREREALASASQRVP